LDQLRITNFCQFESQLCHHEQPRTSILGTISIHIAQITNELIPAIEHAYPVRQGREARSILGVSFSGLNAACFGLLGYDMKFIQKNAGHNWDNWRPLIDDVLLFFYGEL
jgi:enterochelin esterase-like enzyme